MASIIPDQLKKLRKLHNFTLKEASSKAGYKSTGNFSNYENGNLKANDETLIRILTRTYNMSKQEAKARIAMWRRNELNKKYKLYLAEADEKYNPEEKRINVKKVQEYLRENGVSEKIIKGLEKI